MKKGVSMVNRNVFRRKKVHGVGGPSRFWKKSIKKIMNLLFVGVFLSQKKTRILCNFSKFALKILFSPKYMANYAFGKCGF